MDKNYSCVKNNGHKSFLLVRVIVLLASFFCFNEAVADTFYGTSSINAFLACSELQQAGDPQTFPTCVFRTGTNGRNDYRVKYTIDQPFGSPYFIYSASFVYVDISIITGTEYPSRADALQACEDLVNGISGVTYECIDGSDSTSPYIRDQITGTEPGSSCVHLFRYNINNTPAISVSSPANGASYVRNATIAFNASANDPDEGNLSSSIQWFINGALTYTGAAFTASYSDTGTYTVKAKITDSGGLSAEINRSITVQPHSFSLSTPQAVLGTPPYESYKPVTFSVNTATIDGVNSLGSVQWSSNIDGPIGTGASIVTTLSPGAHTISATLSIDGDSITKQVSATIVNDRPYLTIDSPTTNQKRDINETIEFNSTVLFRGITSMAGSMTWGSSIDGIIGTAQDFSLSGLSEGDHLITVTVNQNGEVDTKIFNLFVYDKEKNLGDEGDGQCFGGNPINILTGNKYLEETDFSTLTESPLYLKRSYNSLSDKTGLFGVGWSSNIEQRVEYNVAAMQAAVVDETGAVQRFDLVGGVWVDTSDSRGSLEQLPDNSWRYTRFDNSVKTYNPTGQILTTDNLKGLSQTFTYITGKLDNVTDEYGYTISFTYNAQGYIESLTDPENRVHTYQYNSDNLEYVIYPDLTIADDTDNPRKQYLYEDTNFPNALTGLIDEEGIRFATWGYDDSGRAEFSLHAINDDTFTLVYNADGTTSTINALGKRTTYAFESINGFLKVSTVTGDASANCAASFQSTTYDPATGYADIKTDWRGNQIDLDHNEYGQVESTTVIDTGAGWTTPTDIRTTVTTQYNSLMLPWITDKPGLNVVQLYTPKGRLQTITATDTTTQSVPYSTNGEIRVSGYVYTFFPGTDIVQYVDVDGPRTDVIDTVRNEYDVKGNLIKVINALSQSIQYLNHNSFGQPRQTIDANGLVTDYVYTPRGWLDTKTERSAKGDAITDYDYYANGLIRLVTAPNGASLTYYYNDARQIDYVENNDGEIQDYEPNDLTGDWGQVQYKTAGGVVRYQQSRLFDEKGRQRALLSPDGLDISYLMDPSGNVTQTTQNITYGTETSTKIVNNYYDAFDRVRRREADDEATTRYTYDDAGNLTEVKVEAASDQITGYVYNGFGDLIQETSPATGATIFYRDEAANIVRVVKSDTTETINTHDAINRLQTKSYTGANAENISYTYDQRINGIGRLTDITDQSGSQAINFDDQGYIDNVDYVIEGKSYNIDYSIDSAGQLQTITYLSGRVVTYNRDGLGRVSSVTADDGSGAITLIDNINYEPFGPIASYDFGNGLSRTVDYDLSYRPDLLTHQWRLETEIIDYSFDSADRIRALDRTLQTANTIDSKQFEYDLAGRLEATRWSQVKGESFDPLMNTIEYDYDPVGNRTDRRLKTGAISEAWRYTIDTVNNQLDTIEKAPDAVNYQQINAYGYENTGVTAGDGTQSMTYNRELRLTTISEAANLLGNYLYNANGQRVLKTAGVNTTHFHYGLQGQLLTETDDAGALIRDYVYLGNTPIAMFAGDQSYDNVASSSSTLQWQEQVNLNVANTTEATVLQTVGNNGEISAQLSNLSRNLGKEYVGLTIREQQDGLTGIKIDVIISSVNKRTLSMMQGFVPGTDRLAPMPMFGLVTTDDVLEINIVNSDGSTSSEKSAVTGEWVKLQRNGQNVNVYTSSDGISWTLLQLIAQPALNNAYMGAVVSNATVDITTSNSIANDNVFYLHTDHLNTVTAVSSNSSKNRVWQRNDFEIGASPFGANDLPGGKSLHSGSIEMPLRFPGQYYDVESGKHYNYMRNYDPVVGKYLESDPIGLKAGVNTYGYAFSSPVIIKDFSGLEVIFNERRISATAWGGHTSLQLVPDNAREANAYVSQILGRNWNYFNGSNSLILSGINSDDGTILTSIVNWSSDVPQNSRYTKVLDAPNLSEASCNKFSNDTLFIGNLISSASQFINLYPNGLPYDPLAGALGNIPGIRGENSLTGAPELDPNIDYYNSNSYTSGLLINSGYPRNDIPDPSNFQPGLGAPVPFK